MTKATKLVLGIGVPLVIVCLCLVTWLGNAVGTRNQAALDQFKLTEIGNKLAICVGDLGTAIQSGIDKQYKINGLQEYQDKLTAQNTALRIEVKELGLRPSIKPGNDEPLYGADPCLNLAGLAELDGLCRPR